MRLKRSILIKAMKQADKTPKLMVDELRIARGTVDSVLGERDCHRGTAMLICGYLNVDIAEAEMPSLKVRRGRTNAA